jgi:hypothetical protein
VLPPEWDFFLRLQAGSLRSANDAHLSGMREFLKSAGDREATQSAVLFPLLRPFFGTVPPFSKDLRTMQVPSMLLGESRTRLLQGMAIGAVAAMAIGFSWGGWVTSATSNKLAAEQASTAVVTVLTPICVEKFMQNADAQANLVALRKISSNWQQGDYLEKGGWATRPGATSPDYELGRACAAKLIEAKAVSQ